MLLFLLYHLFLFVLFMFCFVVVVSGGYLYMKPEFVPTNLFRISESLRLLIGLEIG